MGCLLDFMKKSTSIQYVKSEKSCTVYSGLPNIGNTCYLNSTIQLLYSMNRLQQILLLNISRPNNPSTYSLMLKNIFRAIRENEDSQGKRNLLVALTMRVQKQLQIKSNTQQDLLDCFILLIGNLIEENQQLASLVTMKSKKICDCQQYHRLIYSQIIFKLNETCQNCGRQFKLQVLEAPEYLILVPNRKTGKYQSPIPLEGTKETYSYDLVSVAKYTGDTTSGHYNVFVKDKKWIMISDSYVEKDREEPDSAYLCVYHKKTKPQFQSQA